MICGKAVSVNERCSRVRTTVVSASSGQPCETWARELSNDPWRSIAAIRLESLLCESHELCAASADDAGNVVLYPTVCVNCPGRFVLLWLREWSMPYFVLRYAESAHRRRSFDTPPESHRRRSFDTPWKVTHGRRPFHTPALPVFAFRFRLIAESLVPL